MNLKLMGLTKLTMDEVMRNDKTRLQKKSSISAYTTARTFGPFNATNNALDGYETNYTNRWKYIKTPLQSKRHYLKEALTPQRLEPKAKYIKPSTLP